MATTYEAIATVEVGSGGAASIDFTSIPQTYTDLQLLVCARDNDGGTGSGCSITFNGTGWSGNRELYSTGSTVGSGTTSGETIASGNGTTANTFGNATVYIPNYTGSNSKAISADGVSENNATSTLMQLLAGNSGVTAAITSLSITPGGTLFLQYSTATLYGIKNS
jgi:hypothetical protein